MRNACCQSTDITKRIFENVDRADFIQQSDLSIFQFVRYYPLLGRTTNYLELRSLQEKYKKISAKRYCNV